MTIFILILMTYSGQTSSMTSVPGFRTETQCKQAGDKAKQMHINTVFSMSYACLEQKK